MALRISTINTNNPLLRDKKCELNSILEKKKKIKEKEKVHSSLIRLLRHEHHLHPPIAFVSVGTGREGDCSYILPICSKNIGWLGAWGGRTTPLFSSLFSNPLLSSLSSFSLVSLCTHLIYFFHLGMTILSASVVSARASDKQLS